MKIGCIVLAGGKSSRLGRDKASVELGGRTLLQRSVDNLEFLTSGIIIVAAAEQSLPRVTSGFKLNIVRDIASAKGPLVGIYTGLLNSGYDYNFVTACDMPFIQQLLVERMIEMAEGYDAVIPMRHKGAESLHAIYSRRCLAAMETAIKQDNLMVQKALQQVRIRHIEESEIKAIDPGGLSFFNINTPADLNEAAELLDRKTSDIQR